MHIAAAANVKQRLIPAVAARRDPIFVTMSPASIGSECRSWSKHWDYTRTHGTRAFSTAAHVSRVIAQASRYQSTMRAVTGRNEAGFRALPLEQRRGYGRRP
jgi:hypothetical protein